MKLSNFCALIFIFIAPLANAIDTEIRILGVLTGSANEAVAMDHLEYIKSTWPTGTGAQITLVNGGTPEVLTPMNLTGNALAQLNQAEGQLNWNPLRDQYGADVMVVFVSAFPGGTVCGAAKQHNWTKISNNIPGIFIPNPANFGLDTLGKDNSYFVIVATGDSDCPAEETAAHEFGHLLGAGHTVLQAGSVGSYLTNTSHAQAFTIFIPPFGGGGWGGGQGGGGYWTGTKTIVAELKPLPCLTAGITCANSDTYSSQPATNNKNTLGITALSVANYRTGTGPGTGPGGGTPGGGTTQCMDNVDNDGDGFVDLMDGDCSSTADDTESGTSGPPAPPNPGSGCGVLPPTNLQILQIGPQCNPLPYTRYSISWSDGSSCLGDYYELFGSQPDGTPYFFVGSTTSRNMTVFVSGVAARARVRACVNSGGCTSLSSSSVLVVPLC